MLSCHIDGAPMKSRSRTFKLEIEKTRQDSGKLSLVVLKREAMVSIGLGWIPVVLIKRVAPNFRRRSILCTSGIRTRLFAMSI